MSTTFLFIGNREESLTFLNMTKALTALGNLQFSSPGEALERIRVSHYSLIIVDAAVLDKSALLISQIYARKPRARILVLTASPSWRRAREALKAGAMDYLSKSLSEQEYIFAFQNALDQTLPTRP